VRGALLTASAKLALSLVGGALVVQRGARAAAAHAIHQFARARARVGSEGIPGMVQVLEVDAGQADRGDCNPRMALEAAVPRR
jgi:hypothetical protein